MQGKHERNVGHRCHSLRSEPQPLDRTARELPAIHSQDAAIPRVGEEEIREPLRFFLSPTLILFSARLEGMRTHAFDMELLMSVGIY